jgi:hypothetical protein
MLNKKDIKSMLDVIGREILNFAKTEENKNYSDGRLASADFDSRCAVYLKENKKPIESKLQLIIDKASRVKIFIPKDRSFFDIALIVRMNKENYKIIVNNKFCKVKLDQYNNLNGGWKLIRYLFEIKVKTIDELIKYCENNKSLKCNSDYFILEVKKDLTGYNIASIFDGGTRINAAQSFPGIQYNINKSKWNNNHLTTEDKLKIIKKWIKKYNLGLNKKAKKYKIIADAI